MHARDVGSRGFSMVVAALAAATPLSTGHAQTQLASVDASGKEGDSESTRAALSADGRWVVFQSLAGNLVAGDANGLGDVFVRDLATGAVERVSVDSGGVEADGFSCVMSSQAASADGSVVAFSSFAGNLVAYDVNGAFDVFVRDRVANTTELVSVDSLGNQGDAYSADAAVSADGRCVAFDSLATNLVAGDKNHSRDVFVHDRATGATERVSVDSFGAEGSADSLRPSISADGRFVAFMSFAPDLVQNDFNNRCDVFVRDRQLGTTECVSVDPFWYSGNDRSEAPSISGDGNRVAFQSAADDLVTGDSNGWCDVFVRDRAAATTTLVSVASSGIQAVGFSGRPSISADGRVVAFESEAANLVANDTNGSNDLFLRAVAIGYTERISVDSSGGQAETASANVALSGDGRTAAFESSAMNLVPADDNGVNDVFIHSTAAVPASSTHYDAGYVGTHGVPSITTRDLPLLGATITIDLSNSYGRPTMGVILFGTARTHDATERGGDILVDASLVVPITFSYGGDTFTGAMPADFSWFGTTLDLQALELDPGAAEGISFTDGLELVLGW